MYFIKSKEDLPIVIVLFILFSFAIFIGIRLGTPDEPKTLEELEAEIDAEVNAADTKYNAWLMAKEFVKKELKSPSTASFPSFDERNVNKLGSNFYEVTGYVDAQNGFGATLRNNFYCTIMLYGYGKAECDSISIY